MNSPYIEQLIEDGYSNQHNLSIWELDFLDKMDNLFGDGETLTKGQIKKLEEFINK
jgi:hypothetical protein